MGEDSSWGCEEGRQEEKEDAVSAAVGSAFFFLSKSLILKYLGY